MKFTHLLLYSLVLNIACQTFSKEKEGDLSTSIDSEEFVRNKEAREDSIKLAEAYASQSAISESVVADFQTSAVQEDLDEDAADDPAFWFNEKSPEASVIYGSNKKGGIYAYDLTGTELKYYPIGEVNNIDVRKQILFGDEKIDIIGGSNRTNNSVHLMKIDSVGALSEFGNLEIDTTFIDEVYGFCMAKTADDLALAIVNGKNGQIAVYIVDSQNEKINIELLYEWKLPSQPEGMVVDDKNNMLYVGEEEKGIWKIELTNGSTPTLISTSTYQNNDRISYDIEGLSLYQMENPWHESGVLVASIQGSFSYAVFDLSASNNYLGSFKIVDTEGIDGVEETDGLDVVNYDLSPVFPKGMLIVQDGFNKQDGVAVSQNFKVVDMRAVLEFWKEPKS